MTTILIIGMTVTRTRLEAGAAFARFRISYGGQES